MTDHIAGLIYRLNDANVPVSPGDRNLLIRELEPKDAMASPTTPDLISQVFAQFRKDAALPGDDRISESFIKAAGALMGQRSDPGAMHDALRYIDHQLTEYLEGMPGDETSRNLRDAARKALVSEDAERARKLLHKLSARIEPTLAAQSEPATRAVPVAIPHNDWTHELKTDSEVFDAVARGDKTHEIRRNDRNFLTGDTLILRETRYTGQEMSGPEPRPLVYTGRTETRVVSHVLEGYGLQPGWAILSFAAPTPDAERHVANHAGNLQSAPWPNLHGVGRMHDNPCAVLVMLKREPTDDEFRAMHDALAAPAQPTDKENGK